MGKSGIGKTSLCAEFPGVVFVTDDQELGILDLISSGRVNMSRDQVLVAKDYTELLAINQYLLLEGKGSGIKTVCYESYTGFEKLTANHVCETLYGGDWGPAGFLNWQCGPRACANKYFPEIITGLEQLRVNGFNTIMTAHTRQKNVQNVDAPDYAAEVPYALYADCWQCVHRWAESLLFFVYQVTIKKERDGKVKAEAGAPMIYGNRTPQYDAKNKWGIDEPINCDGKSPRELFVELCRYGNLNPETLENL